NGQEPSHITAMKSMMPMDADLGQISQPPLIPFAGYTDAVAATRRLVEIYERNTAFIRAGFKRYTATGMARRHRVRACYPAIRTRVDTSQEVDSRPSNGHVVEPGASMTTLTHAAS